MKRVVGCGAWRMTWRITWRTIWGMWLSLCLVACTHTILTRPNLHFLAWSQDRTTTKRLCVLPFLDRTNMPGIAAQVRQSVAGHLSVKHFTDIELSDIDTRLTTVGKAWRNFAPQQIGHAIGCDALLYGEVTDAGRLYLALYSQLTVAAEIRLVDVATGHPLVQESYATKFREAGVPLSPLSIVPDVVKTWMNLSETQMKRAIDDLSRNLASRVPDLPVPPTAAPGQGALASTTPTLPPIAPTPAHAVTTVPLVLTPQPQPLPIVDVATLSVPVPLLGTTTEKPLLPSSRPASQDQYRLQVAAFRAYDDARRVVRLLRDNGYPAMITQIGESATIWNQVVLGPFPSRAAALKVGIAIRKIAPLSPEVIPRLGR